MTTRRWMGAVAVVGISLTAARLVYLWRHYQQLAAMHAGEEFSYVRQAQGYERKRDWCAQQATIADLPSESARGSTWERLATSSSAIAQDLRRLAAQESRLKLKYEHAARYP
jgi:hypothetical protein